MPNLAPVVDSLDTVPEAARPFYEQRDGKFHIALSAAPSGFVPAAQLAEANGKVVEFRDNNIKLTNEVTELRPLKEQFAGIDPVAAKDAIAKVSELGKKGVKGADDVAALIQTSIDAALKPVKDALTAQTQATEAERKRADESVLKSQITEKFLKAGGKAKAVDYVVGKAGEAFKVEGGEVKALPNKFSAEKPGSPLSVEEWITGLAHDNDFAFEASGGGGADPKRNAGGGGGLKPGQTILMDPTPAQLGEYSKDILTGKVKVQHSNK